jgi:hypothetical protein
MAVSVRERWAVTLAIGVTLAVARLGVLLVVALLGIPITPAMWQGTLAVVTTVVIPLLPAIDAIDAAESWPSLGRAAAHIAGATAYCLFAALIVTLWSLAFNPWFDLSLLPYIVRTNTPTAIVIFATAVGMVRAIRWYHSAAEAEEQRRELESSQIRRTRKLLEIRYRPALVIATVQRIEQMLPDRPQEAQVLLHELARMARRSLRTARQEPLAVEETPALAPLPLDGAPQSVTATLVTMVAAYGATAQIQDIIDTPMAGARISLARIVSILLWLLAGPAVAWITARMSRRRLAVAAMGVTAASLATAIAVSLAALLVLQVAGIGPDTPEMMVTDAMVIVTRNVILATAVAGITFADALARLMVRKRGDAARLRDAVVLTEARRIEADFHPHFLFNALTSIASLIETDPLAAAAMCHRLAALIESTIATAGVERWSVREELGLADDYLAVQMMRFSDRVRIATWDVSAGEAAIPRLLLQPLLENAFKHAVAHRSASTSIGLTIRRRRRNLGVTIWNEAPPAHRPAAEGRGLTFVRRRVDAAGGELKVKREEDGRFIVTCRLPQ